MEWPQRKRDVTALSISMTRNNNTTRTQVRHMHNVTSHSFRFVFHLKQVLSTNCENFSVVFLVRYFEGDTYQKQKQNGRKLEKDIQTFVESFWVLDGDGKVRRSSRSSWKTIPYRKKLLKFCFADVLENVLPLSTFVCAKKLSPPDWQPQQFLLPKNNPATKQMEGQTERINTHQEHMRRSTNKHHEIFSRIEKQRKQQFYMFWALNVTPKLHEPQLTKKCEKHSKMFWPSFISIFCFLNCCCFFYENQPTCWTSRKPRIYFKKNRNNKKYEKTV